MCVCAIRMLLSFMKKLKIKTFFEIYNKYDNTLNFEVDLIFKKKRYKLTFRNITCKEFKYIFSCKMP